jgi:hypothetical protein
MHMANEAQALAGEPQDAGNSEYEAFLAVLSSSARGRAFLDEHARRSRQADTDMLLDALARIEAMLAEQRAQAAQAAVAPPPAPAPPPPPAATALAAVAAQAIAAADCDMPEVKVIKAGQMPPPPPFAGEDFATEPVGLAADVHAAADPATESNVIADTVPPEHAAPLGTPVADALASILALSEEERLALFSCAELRDERAACSLHLTHGERSTARSAGG